VVLCAELRELLLRVWALLEKAASSVEVVGAAPDSGEECGDAAEDARAQQHCRAAWYLRGWQRLLSSVARMRARRQRAPTAGACWGSTATRRCVYICIIGY
jgi:hypothetical protein